MVVFGGSRGDTSKHDYLTVQRIEVESGSVHVIKVCPDLDVSCELLEERPKNHRQLLRAMVESKIDYRDVIITDDGFHKLCLLQKLLRLVEPYVADAGASLQMHTARDVGKMSIIVIVGAEGSCDVEKTVFCSDSGQKETIGQQTAWGGCV